MSGRRSLELKPVPEYDRLSNTPIPNPPATGRGGADVGGSLARSGGNAASAAANTSSGATGTSAAGVNNSGASTSNLGKMSFRLQRHPSSRQMGSLGRNSLVVKLQQGGRQLIDMGRLQASWLSNTLMKRSEEQDYVNEEDQGFVALLARHVDVPHAAWAKLQASIGGADGQFWQSGYATGPDFHRGSLRTSAYGMQSQQQLHHHHHRQDEDEESEGAHAAEEGKAGDPVERKPRPSIYGLPVIQPYNLFAVLWTMSILLLDVTYTAFWVPMNVAFCTAQYGNLSSACTTSDLVGGAFYFLNALLGFQIGVVATNGFRKRIVVDGRQVTWLYVRYGRCWLDVLASVPFVYLVVVLAGRSAFSLDKGWVNCLSLLRLLRMVRLVSISKVVYMDSLSGRFQDTELGKLMSVTVLTSIFLAYQLAVLINLFACIVILCAYFEGYENSWMTSVDWTQLPTASKVYQWYCAVYWMIVTATTTGFGDFQPRSVAEQVVANLVMVGGMIMFGVLVASIGNALSRAASEAFQAYASRQKILHVMEWAEHRALPPDIRKQVQNFYTDKYNRKAEESVDSSVMTELPSRLRAKVAKAMCVPLLVEVHIMEELQDDVLGLIAENMKPIRLPAGEDLCQQGDVASCFWILQEGTVQAVRYKEGSETIDSSEAPQLLGESMLLGEAVESCRVRPWTLRTVTPCRLWGITLAELYPLMRMYPVIAVATAEYVKAKVISLFRCASYDEHWCELAAVIVRQLREQPEAEAMELLAELSKTSAFDGSLQPVLEYILTFCGTRQGAAQGAAAAGRPSARGGFGGGFGAGFGGGTGGGVGSSPRQHGSASVLPSFPFDPADLAAPVAAPAPQTAQTAFSTAAAAATLSAALLGPDADAAGARGCAPHAEGSGFPAGVGAAQGPPPAGALILLGAAHSFPMTTSPALTAAGGSGGGGATAAVQCPGCQRCVCPSCGQGMEPFLAPAGSSPTAATGAAAGAGSALDALPAAAASPFTLHSGVHANPTASPAMRAWLNRVGTLRRVSIGARQDQVWASERRSFDKRHLGAVSLVPYE